MATLTLEKKTKEGLASAENREEGSVSGNNRMTTCLNRMIGRCSNCREDYDLSHHPNNYDCPFYRPATLFVHEVTDKTPIK